MRNSLVTAAVAAAFCLTACGSAASGQGSGNSNSTGSGSAKSSVVVKLKSATVGGKSESVLADPNGMTLYYFTPDSSSRINCSGQCAQLWPALTLGSGTPAAASTMSGVLTALDGPNGRQVLYNGHPLYRFANDRTPSDVNGEGLEHKWFVATPTLASGGGSSTATSPYGY